MALACVLAIGACLAPAHAVEAFAPGRLIVLPNAGLSPAHLDRLVKQHGAKGARRIGNSNLHIVELTPGQEKAVLQKLAQQPHFKFTELDRQAAPALTPNDPYFGSEWHLNKIGAPTAWDLSQGSGVTIAVLDSGVDASHPDLSAQMVPGWNFYANTPNTAPVHGHGTWVAGTAGASNNNGVGVASVGANVKLMPIVVTDSTATAYWSMIAQGITYAADHGARVANISYEKLLNSSAVISAAQYMKSKGGLVVVSAGNNAINEGLTPNASMIAVSATDANDALASFSSYGSYVSIAAPGTPIYTTTVGGGYSQAQGTSFSSPIVAATVALMMSANPTLPNTQIESLLYATAADLGAAGKDIYFGYGRVNASAAVSAARSAVSTVDSQAPAATVSSPVASATVTGLVAVTANASDNVGVSKVELRVNGALVATDTAAPYSFSWDSATVANGMANLSVTAYDAAGNATTSPVVAVNVANAVVPDTTAPAVKFTGPTATVLKSKGSVTIATSASDNSGTAGLKQTLYIDGVKVASGTGGTLSYSWSVTKVSAGAHSVAVTVADAAGNASTATMTLTK